jgi:hypothetical protein
MHPQTYLNNAVVIRISPRTPRLRVHLDGLTRRREGTETWSAVLIKVEPVGQGCTPCWKHAPCATRQIETMVNISEKCCNMTALAGAVHTTYQAKSGTRRSVVSRTTPKTHCSRSGQVRSLLSGFVMRYNKAGNIALFEPPAKRSFHRSSAADSASNGMEDAARPASRQCFLQ